MPTAARSKPGPNGSTRWRAYAFLLLNVVCWGAALVFVKPALEFATPFRFLFYRFVLAGVLASGFIWNHWGQIKQPYRAVATITKLELIGVTVSLGLLYVGLRQTTAIAASLLTTGFPIFLTLAGIFFLKEREEKHEWLGLGLAFGGTLLIAGLPFLQATNFSLGGSFMGNCLVILSDVTTALYFVLAKKHYRPWPKLFVASISFWVGAITFFILSLAEQHWQLGQLWHQISQDWQHPAVWFASGYMAVFGSIIGLTAYIKGQDGIEASEASVFSYLQPLIYLPLSLIWLHETVHLWQWLGLGLILAGVVLTEMRRRMI